MPAEMVFADLRRGTDVEFGQSLYEPFGIAQLEPLSSGALCVVSDVCGCLGFVASCAGDAEPAGIVRASYPRLSDSVELPQVLRMGQADAARAEDEESRRIARLLATRLALRPRGRGELLQQGGELARQMSWERVAESMLLPALERL